MILIICGGNSKEREVSILSANYIENQLKKLNINYLRVILQKNLQFISENKKQYSFTYNQHNYKLTNNLTPQESYSIDFVIPCIHGTPGEDGKIQAFLDLISIPYMGSKSEASSLCFNKISTKLWAQKLKIPVTQYIILQQNNKKNILRTLKFLDKHHEIFIKASNQGSSIGIFKINHQSKDSIAEKLSIAFSLSPYVLIEKGLKARELEVAVFSYKNKLYIEGPGEINCPINDFYTYDQKYNKSSHSKVEIQAVGISENIKDKLHLYSKKLFQNLKIEDLARIDYFLKDEDIFLNEINTFPGHTNISMFPLLLENTNIKYSDFLQNLINNKRTNNQKEKNNNEIKIN